MRGVCVHAVVANSISRQNAIRMTSSVIRKRGAGFQITGCPRPSFRAIPTLTTARIAWTLGRPYTRSANRSGTLLHDSRQHIPRSVLGGALLRRTLGLTHPVVADPDLDR